MTQFWTMNWASCGRNKVILSYFQGTTAACFGGIHGHQVYGKCNEFVHTVNHQTFTSCKLFKTLTNTIFQEHHYVAQTTMQVRLFLQTKMKHTCISNAVSIQWVYCEHSCYLLYLSGGSTEFSFNDVRPAEVQTASGTKTYSLNTLQIKPSVRFQWKYFTRLLVLFKFSENLGQNLSTRKLQADLQ
jgi:hypothetical protein